MKQSKFLTGLFIVIGLLMANFTLALAQDEGTASYANAVYDTSDPAYTCAVFDLEIDGLRGHQVEVNVSPFLVGEETALKSLSGDTDQTSPKNAIFGWQVLDVPFDSSIWSTEGDNPIRACVDNLLFPWADTGDTAYDFDLVIQIFDLGDSNGENVGTINGQKTDVWDLSKNLRPLHYEVAAPTARVAFVHYSFDAVDENGDSAIAVSFFLEVTGYANTDLLLAVYPIASETVEPMAASRKDFADKNGALFATAVVNTSLDHAAWTPLLDGGEYFTFFLPYDAFPGGTYDWFPEILILDPQTKTIIFDHSFTGNEVTNAIGQ